MTRESLNAAAKWLAACACVAALSLAGYAAVAHWLRPVPVPPPAPAQLRVEGDTVVVIKALPFRVAAPPGAALYLWSLPDALKASGGDDTVTVTAAPKGTHRVRCVMLTVDFATKAVRKETAEIDCVVGDVPGPGPVPPGPTPTPDVYGLAKASRDGLAAVASPNKAAEAARLAAAQRTHAAAVAAGAFADKAKALDGWRAANKAALTEAERAAWGGWASLVAAKLKEVDEAGRLPGNNELSAAFREIADGLEGR